MAGDEIRQHHFTLKPSGKRLDLRLQEAFPGASRSAIVRALKDGAFRVDDSATEGPKQGKSLRLKPNFVYPHPLSLIYEGPPLGEGDRFASGSATSEGALKTQTPAPPPAPELYLDILFEDENLIVINKPQGIVVHPAPGHTNDTILNAVLARGPIDDPGAAPERPGIVHRLDRDTSGTLVVAKNQATREALQAQWRDPETRPVRRYRALVLGSFQEEEGEIRGAIGRDPDDRTKQAVTRDGRSAHTRFEVLANWPQAAELKLDLLTGRMHQIRVHLAGIGHPVIGDPVYSGGEEDYERLGLAAVLPRDQRPIGQALHAEFLSFRHPVTGETMEMTAPPPSSYLSLRFALASQALSSES